MIQSKKCVKFLKTIKGNNTMKHKRNKPVKALRRQQRQNKRDRQQYQGMGVLHG